VPRGGDGGSSPYRPTGTGGYRPGHGHSHGYGPSYGYRPGYGWGGGYYGYSGWYFGIGYGFGYPSWGWPGYYGYRAHPYYYYPAYGGYVAADSGYAKRPVELGAVDLGIKPKRARVYLDGRYIGLAKQFDGTPNYLWVERGGHTLTFYHTGYQNSVRTIVVDTGQVLTLKDTLHEGQAVLPEPPEELERAPSPERPGRATLVQESNLSAASAANDACAEPARLTLDIVPQEASIYLSGRFLGSGREISNLRAPLIIDAGDHVLQVVHPDYRTEKREISVAQGETLDLEIELGSP
jgi:hypothetical protein